jgi:hypothetical protein
MKGQARTDCIWRRRPQTPRLELAQGSPTPLDSLLSPASVLRAGTDPARVFSAPSCHIAKPDRLPQAGLLRRESRKRVRPDDDGSLTAPLPRGTARPRSRGSGFKEAMTRGEFDRLAPLQSLTTAGVLQGKPRRSSRGPEAGGTICRPPLTGGNPEDRHSDRPHRGMAGVWSASRDAELAVI